ncbi:MAG: GNAT family N-acetyltransferase [Acidobacteriota bacterium]
MPRIEGKQVVLREFRREDVPVIHSWANDPSVVRYLTWAVFPQTLRETEHFVESQMGGNDPLNRGFVIALREGDTCIGTTGCHNIDWRNRCAELGIVIGKRDYLGKGYGTEAVDLLLGFSFRELNLHRVFLRVFDFNERAVQAYRKCGFVEEGRLREAFFREGRYHDILLMGILEEEYRSRSSS